MIITKSTDCVQPIKITINKEGKQCIAIKTNWKTLKQRNKFVITLIDCHDPNNNGELLMYWLYNSKDGTIKNFNVPDRKLCSEFGSKTDSNLHFLRAISTNLDQDHDQKAIKEREERHRNCYNWNSVYLENIDTKNAITPPIHYAFQENIPQQNTRLLSKTAPKYILAPTEFTTSWLPSVRNGIVMVEFKVDSNGMIIVDEADKAQLQELKERFAEFKFRLRAKLGLRAAGGVSVLVGCAIPPVAIAAAGISANVILGAGLANLGAASFVDGGIWMNNKVMEATRDEFKAEKERKGFTVFKK